MYSENDTRHFFQLLRSGLKPDCAPAVTGEISAREWDDIFRMAADQGVCAVIGDGMERLPEELRPPRELRLRWALTAERQEKRYRRQQEKAAKMAAVFAENGIRLLLLKGLGLSRNYPVPAHRECGDIDIYLFGASDEGDRLLLQMGAQPYFDVPKHSSHTWDGILIENHRTILNVRRNRSERELNALLTAVLEQEGVCEIGENIAVPPATFNAIYLLRHAAVHYQKEGIAVRHLCDWACFLERHGHEIDRQLFHKALNDYRLDRFEALMTAAAVRYLGAEVPEPSCDAGMLERFMREIYAVRPMPTRTLAKLRFKLFGPIHNRWRLRRVLRTSPWRYYYDTIRAQWNERFTLFR
ncbi:nucleotidyltransferase family protein [Alistipes finegoldii]|uniref:nucleotidyltransferase domain-containing protein n=1 Tax=Alistipes finegoldii TaxID=214856 RepID=UPI003080BEB9